MAQRTQEHDNPDRRRARGRRLTLWLSLLATGFYVGFVLLSILRGRA